MFRLTFTAAVLLSAMAVAQTEATPEEEWGNFPSDPNALPPVPPPIAAPLAPPPPTYVPGRPVSPPPSRGGGIVVTPAPPQEPNRVSMYGGATLGQWKRGQTIFLGFPLLGVKLAIGLLDRLDFALGFESFWGVMNEFSTSVRVGIYRGSNWSLAGSVDGMFALFGVRASKEVRGPRWITSHRNWGLSPSFTLSYQGNSPRAVRLFATLGYLLTFDTEPFARDPLSGVPAALQFGHNILVHFGAEMPLSARTSFVFLLGMDFHGRPEDSIVMPVAALGLVTGI